MGVGGVRGWDSSDDEKQRFKKRIQINVELRALEYRSSTYPCK
jgi:hypothetical protein